MKSALPLALPLFFIGMMLALVRAVLEIQLSNSWGYLWIWCGGWLLLAFGLWPVRKHVIKELKETFS